MRKITVAGVRRRLARARVEVGQRIAGTGARPVENFAAGFVGWLRRNQGQLFRGFPDHWREHDGLTIEDPCRLAVVMHVYYVDLVPELVAQLHNIPISFDLIVTNSSGQPLQIDGLPDQARSVRTFEIENHGRDIYPLIATVNAGLLNPYELVLKVHTKKSVWRESHNQLNGSGDEWKRGFFDALLGSPANVKHVLSAFAADPSLGVVTADGSVLGADFWGGDRPITDALLRRLELSVAGRELRFPAGSMYWIRSFVLQGLRSLCVDREDFEEEAGQVDGTTAHAIERIIGILAEEAGFSIAERSSLSPSPDASMLDANFEHYATTEPREPRARVIPFYLPQFHAFEENDRWWGTGFTEWTNLTTAVPVFQGHNQPLLPADLGFYDLASDDVRRQQRELSSSAGIEGFMYYYYWFAGKRLMSKPIESLMASDIDQPFCIMWANENWTRRWDGRQSDILIGQDYEHVPAEDFIDDVIPFLMDPRYIRIEGKAVLAVYRIAQIPDYEQVIQTWRERAKAAGAGEIELLTVDVSPVFDGLVGHPAEAGMDGILEFPPHNQFWHWLPYSGLGVDPRFQGNILSYAEMVTHSEQRMATSLDLEMFPGVMVNFDNTARRQWAPELWYGSNPYTFRRWLNSVVQAVADRDFDRRVVFVNAWNEWAESAVMEPTQRFGSSYLLATKSVIFS